MLDLIKTEAAAVTLNPEARFIFEQIDGRRTMEEIAERVAEVYEAPMEVIQRDTIDVLLELQALGLIQINSSGETEESQ